MTVTLLLRESRASTAIVVQGEGDTRDWLYVVEVVPEPPEFPDLRLLLREWYEGDPMYRFGAEHMFLGVKLPYLAAHVVDSRLFPGHVFLARNFGWQPSTHTFRRGSLYVDATAESKASLLDLLLVPGSSRLGVILENYDEERKTGTYLFKPVGLLRRKIPCELWTVPRIRATIALHHDAATGEEQLHLLQLEGIDH